MRFTLLSLVLSAWCMASWAQRPDLKQLYQQIDEAIEQSPNYVAAYEERLAGVTANLNRCTDPSQQLVLSRQLFELYQGFNNDSALHYIQLFIETAQQQGLRMEADHGRALLARQCSAVGLYTESLGILNRISSDSLRGDALRDYYLACMHVCGELAYNTTLPATRSDYYRMRGLFRDSVLMVSDPQTEAYLMCQEQQLLGQNKLEEALQVNDHRLALVEPDTRDYAIVSFYRNLIFSNMGNADEAAYWLCQSALADIKNAVMDQAALIELANRVNADGDVKRSYRFIRFTWDCNNRFNTRMRSWQIAPILNVIENNYQNELQRSTRILIGTMVAISVLALLLLLLLIFLHRRNKLLNAARQQVHQANEQLRQSNAQLAQQANELSALNTQQKALNAQLKALNTQLSEANQVKEEYIGRFMSLCSQYIDKLDNYRKMVNKKMKNKELDELFRISKSTELKEKELEELFENFDSVFLHLFPTFVTDFNNLLQPEFHVQPKEDNRLSTDLRIFALIRLGIEDSSKIAEFLHYSVNTIYNYRARTKNGALGDRSRFEEQLKHIGLPEPAKVD